MSRMQHAHIASWWCIFCSIFFKLIKVNIIGRVHLPQSTDEESNRATAHTDKKDRSAVRWCCLWATLQQVSAGRHLLAGLRCHQIQQILDLISDPIGGRYGMSDIRCDIALRYCMRYHNIASDIACNIGCNIGCDIG